MFEVTIVTGANQTKVSVDEGSTISDVYDECESLFNLPTDPSISIDGREGRMGDTVVNGSKIEFAKSAGKKG